MTIQVNTDLRKFKAKDIGNFTFKEAGFIVIGIAIGALLYFLQSGEEKNLALALIPAAIVMVFGFLKPFGMEMKDAIRYVFPEKFMYPKILKWDSDYIHEEDEAKKLFGDDYELVYFGLEDNHPEAAQKGKTKKNKKISK